MAAPMNYSLWLNLVETLKSINIAAGISSFATFVNMCTTLFIYKATRQSKNISVKQFKSDLFKQRYELFSEMLQFISDNFPPEDKSEQDEKTKRPLLDFIFMSQKAKFLFSDPQLTSYIDEVIKQLYISYRETKDDEIIKNQESIRWLKDQIKSGDFIEHFKASLTLPK